MLRREVARITAITFPCILIVGHLIVALESWFVLPCSYGYPGYHTTWAQIRFRVLDVIESELFTLRTVRIILACSFFNRLNTRLSNLTFVFLALRRRLEVVLDRCGFVQELLKVVSINRCKIRLVCFTDLPDLSFHVFEYEHLRRRVIRIAITVTIFAFWIKVRKHFL